MTINPFLHHVKSLVKQSKYIIPILSIFSIVKQVFFYSFFQIQIAYYISLTEILSIFLNDAVLYCLFYVILLVTYAFLPTTLLKFNNEQINAKAKHSFFKRLFFQNGTITMLLLPFMFSIFLLIMGKPWEYTFAVFSSTSLLFFLMFLRDEIIRRFDIKFTIQNVVFFNNSALLCMLFIFMLSRTLSQVYFIKYANYEHAILISDERIFDCKDSLALLGSTQNYTFIYNNKTKVSIVLPNSKLKETKLFH